MGHSKQMCADRAIKPRDFKGKLISSGDTVQKRVLHALSNREGWVVEHINDIRDLRSSIEGEGREAYYPDTDITDDIDDNVIVNDISEDN